MSANTKFKNSVFNLLFKFNRQLIKISIKPILISYIEFV